MRLAPLSWSNKKDARHVHRIPRRGPWLNKIDRARCGDTQQWQEVGKAERLAQADLVRDLFGPLPFRPVSVNRAWLAWDGGTVAKLAAATYEERAFDRLPILADALEEAGCADAELLGHLRGPGPHVRGCWVLDLLLGQP